MTVAHPVLGDVADADAVQIELDRVDKGIEMLCGRGGMSFDHLVDCVRAMELDEGLDLTDPYRCVLAATHGNFDEGLWALRLSASQASEYGFDGDTHASSWLTRLGLA